jgi:HK97 family phage portal protein
MGLFLDLVNEYRSENSMQNAITSFLNGDDFFHTTKAGAFVSQENSLSLTAVYACVKIIAWTIASLPIHTYERLTPHGKNRAYDHSVYQLLKNRPNPEQTAFEWKSLMSVHQNLWGAGISEIEFDRNGNPVALWPIPPWCVELRRTITDKTLFYRVRVDNEIYDLSQSQVVVFQSMSTSRNKWLSPIGVHRETLGASLAVKEFGALTFGQGTNPAGIVSVDGALGEKARDSLREQLKGYAGLSNSHRIMLLEGGQKFERVGLPPEDAQYLQTMKFNLAEIARIYNVPLPLIQEHEKSTTWGTGLEEMNSGFVTFCLRPYLVQWEQELMRKLIYEDRYFVEFLVEGLLRGKQKERFEAYAIARQWGWLNPDDIREIENQNPLPDNQGQIYLVPMNMVNAKFAGERQKETVIDNGNKGAKDA